MVLTGKLLGKCDALGVNFSKVAGLKPATLLKLTLLYGFFHIF